MTESSAFSPSPGFSEPFPALTPGQGTPALGTPQSGQATPSAASYGADSIQVLTAAEAQERMPWLRADTLARDYSLPIEYVRRLIETCRRSGWPLDQAVARYKEGDTSVPVPPEVQAAHREVVREAQERYQRGCTPDWAPA